MSINNDSNNNSLKNSRNSLNNSLNNITPTASSINSSGNFSPKEFVSNVEDEDVLYENKEVEFKERLVTLLIKPSTLIIRYHDKNNFTKYLVADTIVGTNVVDKSVTIYSCVMNTIDITKESRRRKQFTFTFKNSQESNKFNKNIEDLFLNILPRGNPKTRKIRVILNPKSGKKMSESIFNEINQLFLDSKIQVKKTVTKGPDHAKKIGYKFNLKKYDTIVFISGDGLFHEFINGLLSRSDYEEAKKIPLALIPGGTGNGIACSIGLQDPMSCALAVIRGFTKPLDISVIQQGESKWCSILSLTWGLVSDVDIESEKWRRLGDLRLVLGAAIRILNLRIYKGKILYLPAIEISKNEMAKIPKCSYSCEICESDDSVQTINEIISNPDSNNLNNNNPLQYSRSSLRRSLNNSGNNTITNSNTLSSSSGGSLLTTSQEDRSLDELSKEIQQKEEELKRNGGGAYDEDSYDNGVDGDVEKPLMKSTDHYNVPSTKLPNQQFLKQSESELLAKGWKKIEGEFIGIVASTVSHLASDFIASPSAHLSDGLIDLVVIKSDKRLSKAGLLSILTESSTGNHVKSDLIDQYKVSALILDPSTEREGIIAVDGEKITYGRTSMECMRGCINLICRSY